MRARHTVGAGLLSYADLWAWQHEKDLEEGMKDRLCAIIAAHQAFRGAKW